MQNYTDDTNGHLPLTIENVRYFKFLLRQGGLLERKTKLINHFIYKNNFLLNLVF